MKGAVSVYQLQKPLCSAEMGEKSQNWRGGVLVSLFLV